MRLITVAVLSAASLAALSALPAAAQSPRYDRNAESITVIDQYGHRTTRIRVRPRSFLDPGNNVEPGSQHYTDYAMPLDNRGTDYLYDRNDPKSSWSRMPLPTCFDVPGYCRNW